MEHRGKHGGSGACGWPLLLPSPYNWQEDGSFPPVLHKLPKDCSVIPETEWKSRALLTVDIVNPGNLVEITILGQPRVQNQVKRVLLSLSSWPPEHRARVVMMEQLEESLKACAPCPQTPQCPVA
uniref:KH-like RNA-binding domain-containing protein n=1 Tax=Equus asinus TaxID=9793 RepID=A0A8C4MZC4_EQUAS